MDKKLENILKAFILGAVSIYGNHLKQVFLYGSYARGDNRDDSDIDLMLLVDLDEEEIKKLARSLSDFTFDINFDNDVEIMPVVKNKKFFEKWVRAYPFFNNVLKDGIEIYAA